VRPRALTSQRTAVGRLARALLFCAASAFGACRTTDVPPLTEQEAAYGVAADEQRLLRESERFEHALREKGLVDPDPALQRYVSAVGARAVPSDLPESLEFHFFVLREPTINAFSLANGGIYLHTGLLARLENEAQLAHVLSHEVAHTLHRHQLEYTRHAGNRIAAAKLAQIVLLPPAGAYGGALGVFATGSLIGLSVAASVNGFGREEEREADRVALETLARAGYPVDESSRLFELLQEVEDAGRLEGFFYSSHPANAERARYTREVVESGTVRSLPGADDGRLAFARATRGVLAQNVRLRLRAGHYQYARSEAERALGGEVDEALLRFYIGESHRLTAIDPEGAARERAFREREGPSSAIYSFYLAEFREQKQSQLTLAVEAYERALELDSELARAHRGLGLVAHERADRETAERELGAYLEAKPKATDRRYIEWLLRGGEGG
jgi:predicted Zn-dependent protease